jgi:hypothetical protein
MIRFPHVSSKGAAVTGPMLFRLTTEGNSQTFQTLILGSDVGRAEYGGREAGVI